MPKALMIAYTNPSHPEREDEYNDWYDNVHIPQILSIPGFVSATRYQLSAQQIVPGERPRGYVAVYELECEDIHGAVGALVSAVSTGQIEMSDALEMDPLPDMSVFELIGCE